MAGEARVGRRPGRTTAGAVIERISTHATVADILQAGLGSLAFIGASGSNPSTSLTLGSVSVSSFSGTMIIPSGQTLTVLLRATATSDGAAVNSASVVPATLASDTNLTNNTARATVVVGPAAELER